jgi:TetR/AcrR family transcriptional regulator, transcriptional repressor of bet genes
MPGTKYSEAIRREQVIAAAYGIAATEGLRAVTIRDVAARAGMSSGLVLFHFVSKEQLVLELLDWVLSTTTALQVGPAISAIPSPLERLVALLAQEMARLSSEPALNRLFFEFWSAGLSDASIRARMKPELDRYRAAFRPIAAAVIDAEPDRFPNTTADGLAAVAVSFIKGCAVQSMIEPSLDITEFLEAANGLLRRPLAMATTMDVPPRTARKRTSSPATLSHS